MTQEEAKELVRSAIKGTMVDGAEISPLYPVEDEHWFYLTRKDFNPKWACFEAVVKDGKLLFGLQDDVGWFGESESADETYKAMLEDAGKHEKAM